MPDINKKYVLYYAVRGYATGQAVTIDIFDTVGTKEIDSGSMPELNSTGIYTFNWFPRKRTTYLVVMNCALKPRQQHEVIRIEKPKLSGAISIPRIKIPDPVWQKQEKLDIIKKLSNLSIPAPLDYSDTLDSVLSLLKEVKLNQTSQKRGSAVLRVSLKKEREAILSQLSDLSKLKKEFQSTVSSFHSEVSSLSKKICDEMNTNLKLSTPVNSVNKIERLLSVLDETNLLLKHAT